MSDEREREPLAPEELEATNGEELPDREAMSVVPIADPIGGTITLPVEPPATE